MVKLFSFYPPRFIFPLSGALSLPVFLLFSQPAAAEFTSLNMGLDYRLRGVAIENNDYQNNTQDHFNYYSQSARFYMTTWLNEDVEASLRLHSINIWGLEGSTTPATRYPSADGTPWIEEAYIHLPHFAWNRANMTIGRQPLLVGDGMIVSDDQLGFNAIRAKMDLPWRFDLDLFTAKITESLGGEGDFNLHGAVLGADHEHNRWELAWIQEDNKGNSQYLLSTSTFTSTRASRRFYDLRLFGNLKDAYYKIEMAMQSGQATLQPNTKIDLKGIGQKLELGAQADTMRFGRFGVRAIYAVGTGDDAGTSTRDEAFRPTFARRWSGLQRVGYGTHYAATLSDAYDPNNPFSPTATGLPAGVSGIKTMGLGLFSVQKVLWTGALDYYIYEARTKPAGASDIGAELDGEITYRYTGFVTFKLGMAYFFPGEIYGANASRVTRYTAEAHVHF